MKKSKRDSTGANTIHAENVKRTKTGSYSNIVKEIKHEGDKPNRRLDSLARLLEGSMLCSATYLSEKNILYVTTNSIYKTKKNAPNNSKTKYLQKILSNFCSDEFLQSKPKSLTETDVNILLEIYFEKLKSDFQRDQKNMPQINIDQQKKIIVHLSANREKWLDMNKDSDFSKFLSDDDVKLYSKYSTLSHREKSHLQQNFAVVRQSFNRLWTHVRDFLKVKSFILDQDLNIKDFRILAIGSQNEHAEMRILSFIQGELKLVDNPVDSTQYIGISKLCCPDCICTIESINQIFNSNDQTKIIAVFDSESEEEGLGEIGLTHNQNILEASIEEEKSNTFLIRGSHQLTFSKWQLPEFLKGEKFLASDNYFEWSATANSTEQNSSSPMWADVKVHELTNFEKIYLNKLKSAYKENFKKMEIFEKNYKKTSKISMNASESSSSIISEESSEGDKKSPLKADIFEQLVPEENEDEKSGKFSYN